MLTDEQLEVLGSTLTPLFQRLEYECISDVGRRIRKTMTYTRTAELTAMRLRELGYSPAHIRSEAMRLLRADADYRKAVAKNTMDYKLEVQRLIRSTLNQAMHDNDEVIKAGGNMAWVDDLRVWKDNTAAVLSASFLPEVIDTYKHMTNEALKNLTRTLAFKNVQGLIPLENLYTRELDFAMVQLLSGTFSSDEIVKKTVHNMAQSGLRSIDFASGRTMELDTHVRLAMRTGYHQLAGEITNKNLMQSGVALVWVSEHWGARNTGIGVADHEAWQGKIYYTTELPPADAMAEAERIGQEDIENIWTATGYDPTGKNANDPLGLYGYNCRHSHSPWFDGMDKPKYTPEPSPITYNGKEYDYYAMTQRQRAIEIGRAHV